MKKPRIHRSNGMYAVDVASYPLVLCFTERADAWEYARLSWLTMLATYAYVERGWPKELH